MRGKERKMAMIEPSHQCARTATRAIAVLISLLTLLQVLHSNGVVAALSEAPSRTAYTISTSDNTNDNDAEYESKIQKALSHHTSKSRQLLERALEQGGAALIEMEIGSDGNVLERASDISQEELWQAEFALQALEHELRTLLNDLGESRDDASEDNDSDDDDSEDGYHSADDEEYDSGDYYDEHGDHSSDYAGDYDSGDDYDDGDEFVYEDGISKAEYLRRDTGLKKILDAIDDRTARNDSYEDIRDQTLVKNNLDPDAWYGYTYWELHAYFSCRRWFASKVPVYDSEKWADVRQHWNDFRDEDVRKYPIPEGEPERAYQFTEGEFDPPTTPFFAGGAKGRGLKASRDISEGELVFKATNNTVVFTHGHTWRKFLFSLYERNGEPYDSGTACDVLVWSWVQPIEENGPLVIVADLDNGSLLNEGREDEPGWEMPNVRCGKEGDTMCMMSYYATKHIKAGEELLCNYHGFALLHAWPDMGL